MALTGGGVSPENFCPLSWGKKFRGHRLSTHRASASEGLDNRPEGGKTQKHRPALKGASASRALKSKQNRLIKIDQAVCKSVLVKPMLD